MCERRGPVNGILLDFSKTFKQLLSQRPIKKKLVIIQPKSIFFFFCIMDIEVV